ncbi:GerAB/ArcD/ProY family transporter [Cohnella luojiensis]|uniref:Uncharacterized protein n=1 Tax=Cohnella luojiensis TaxID=652876 RepID=A0A4Y8LSH3_9BACL|nr:GerAB/ArcD/ProY family transporter [Cohnella luojiensis]TFE24292.1 hypothetical protein E2980_16810 [Cohnella luojiensis]
MNKSLHVLIMYILVHLGFIFFMYPGDIISSSEEGHWIPILIGCIVHLLVIWTYMKGMSYFPDRNIIQIYSEAGRIASVVFLGPVALYSVMVSIITIRAYSEVISIVFLSNTPLWSMMFFMLLISTYVASKGGEAIFRTGILIAVLFLPVVVFIFFSSFQNVDWRYVFPMSTKDFSFFAKRSFYESFFAFAGGFLFLGFVQPLFKYKSKHVLICAVFFIPFFLFSVYVPLLTFGQATASTFHFPYIVTMDSVHLNWLMFDRLTMFFLLSLVTFILLFVGLVLWMTVSISKRFIPIFKSYQLAALVIVIYSVCLIIPEWEIVQNLFWWNSILRFYVLIAVPISILIFGLRSKGKGARERA